MLLLRDGVGHDDFVQSRCVDPLDSVSAEPVPCQLGRVEEPRIFYVHSMRDQGIDLLSTFFLQKLGSPSDSV